MPSRVSLFISLLSVFFLQTVVRAQIFSDGGFESGTLSYWSPAGNVSIDQTAGQQNTGSYSAVFNANGTVADGQISQTFTVPAPGQPYLLSFHYAAFGDGVAHLLRYEISCDGTVIFRGSRTPGSEFKHHVQFFRPTTTNVTLTFFDGSLNPRASGTVIDDIDIAAVAPFSHPGTYIGTMMRGLSIPNTNISKNEVRRVTASIGADGYMVILEQPGSTTAEATIDDTGKVTTLSGGGVSAIVQGTIRNTTIRFTAVSHDATDTGTPIDYTRTFTLTKTSH